MLAAHVLLAIRELRLAADLGAGHRPACARSTVGRSAALQFGCVTVCQGCVSATPCPRCAALVQPSAKIQLRDLRADQLAPKADTLERRFPVCWVQPRRFLRVEHGPPFRRVGDLLAGRARPAWRLAFRIQVHMKPLVPRQDRPTRQRPGGRYTAWPWPGLSRSSRGFRLRQQNREPAEMFRPTREPHGERCGKQDRGGHLKKPRRHVFRRSGANEIRTACAGTGCNRI